MIKDSYPLLPSPDFQAFKFKSIGTKGVIEKAIIFEFLHENRYNLAFGDIKDDNIDDTIISNNNDIVNVISTIAKAVYEFLEYYPDALIEIEGIDKKRQRLYNHIFKRRFKEIETIFVVNGVINKQLESYNPEKYYDKFEIQLKHNIDETIN